jgi:polysaccharide pyruvyl transferase WcaK-like protein
MLLGVTYNTNNYGVRVLLSGTVSALAARHENLEFLALDYQHTPATWHEETPVGSRSVKLINLRFSWKLYLANNVFTLLFFAGLVRLIPFVKLRRSLLSQNRTIRLILESKACLSMSGGDSFSDIYGLVRLFYVAAPQLLAICLGLPLIQLPQTFGPFKSRRSRLFASYILRRSAAIYSRDLPGRSLVQALLKNEGKTIHVSPDFGFYMAETKLAEAHLTQIAKWRHNRVVVGLNTSKLLYLGGYSGSNMFGLREDYVVLTHCLLEFLLSQPDVFVLLIPHVFGEGGEGELPLCRQLLAEFLPKYPQSIGFLEHEYDHREIKSVIGECDLFIGARMHACIAAVSRCVPTIALAYSDKFKGVMDMVASPAISVIDLRSAQIELIVSAFNNLHAQRENLCQDLRQRIPIVEAQILATSSKLIEQTL